MVTEQHAAGALDGSVDPEELTTLLAQENQALLVTLAQLKAENSALKAAQPAAGEPAAGEPEPFIVGNQYRTQAGDIVRFVAVHNEGKSYETMEDESGVNRYTRRDFGRCTGTAHDYSDPRNTPPLWTAPPAAAHGDEAVQKPSWKDEHEAFKSWARSRITPLKLDLDEVGLFYDEVAGVAHDAWHARAAMRAQGDGGEA